MPAIRKHLFKIIEIREKRTLLNSLYDSIMVVVVLLSLIPMMLMEQSTWSYIIEYTTAFIFIIDYICRWMTADFLLRKGRISFVVYPFTTMAIIDLLSIIPTFTVINDAFKVTRLIRLLRCLRVFRILYHSRRIRAFKTVFVKERQVLCAVLMISLIYILITALVLFNVEPHINPITGEHTFNSFLDALYWATVTLTTVGYGDLCPTTDAGRIISMFSSFFGIAIIALPSGVITASYLEELHKMNKNLDVN